MSRSSASDEVNQKQDDASRKMFSGRSVDSDTRRYTESESEPRVGVEGNSKVADHTGGSVRRWRPSRWLESDEAQSVNGTDVHGDFSGGPGKRSDTSVDGWENILDGRSPQMIFLL